MFHINKNQHSSNNCIHYHLVFTSGDPKNAKLVKVWEKMFVKTLTKMRIDFYQIPKLQIQLLFSFEKILYPLVKTNTDSVKKIHFLEKLISN